MDYLTEIVADPRVSGADWHPLFAMMDDNRVGRFLRARGYEQHQFGSWWVGTHHNPNAVTNTPMGLSEFNMTYFRRTIVMPILHLLPDSPRTMQLNWDNGQCQRIARQVEAIKAVGPRDRPVYVFAHLLVPHGPFVFTADGRCLEQKASEARGEPRGYAEQVAYADTIIEDLVTTLLAEGRPEPVVLIQADEGPIPTRDLRIPWTEASDAELRIKFGILNAYPLPRRRLQPAAAGHLAGQQLPGAVRHAFRRRPAGAPGPDVRLPRPPAHLRAARRDRPGALRGAAGIARAGGRDAALLGAAIMNFTSGGAFGMAGRGDIAAWRRAIRTTAGSTGRSSSSASARSGRGRCR